MQFASALAVAERHGKAASTDLDAAAKLLVADQKPDGSWQLDQSQSLGSPATYGTIIATWSARSTLIASGMQPDNFTVVQADRWIRGLTLENVLDASATMLALELSSDVMAENLRRTCLSIVRNGQSPDGRLGPVRHRAATGLRHRDGRARAQRARSRTAPRAIDVSAEELKEAIANGKKYHRLAAAPRWQLAGDDATRGSGELRAAHLDDGLGAARVAANNHRHRTHVNHRSTERFSGSSKEASVLRCFCASVLTLYLTLNGISVFSGSAELSVRSN